jgi:hypothetical protein
LRKDKVHLEEQYKKEIEKEKQLFKEEIEREK